MKVNELTPADYNPRKITDAQLSALAKAMAEFGDLSGIVFNISTGTVIGGHQRIKNLDPEWPVKKKTKKDSTGTVAVGHIETPWGEFTYREVDWPEEKEKAANIAANKHGGVFDIPKLAEILTELNDGEFDMSLTGFDPDEFQALTSTYTDGEGTGGNDDTPPEEPPEDNYAEQYGVIVLCENEGHQEEVYNRLHEEGFNVKVVNT